MDFWILFFQIIQDRSIEVAFNISAFSVFIPIIKGQCYQNPYHNQEYFSRGLFEVIRNFTFFKEFLADFPE